MSTSWGGAGPLAARRERATAALAGLGYDVRLMPNALAVRDGRRDWVAGTREGRLADLHAAFADPEVDAVLSAIGGDHSAELLEDLDFDLLAANPKFFCGYSDTTSLLCAVHARTGLITFYGPAMLPEFGEIGGPDAEVVEWFERLVGVAEAPGALPVAGWQATEDRAQSDEEGRPRRREPGQPRTVLREGEGAGPLLVACLPSLRTLLGTPWAPEFAGRILVVEPPEAPYDPEWADADLIHLRNAGALADVAGLVLGRTEGWSESATAAFHQAALGACRGTKFGVLAGVECSHTAPLLALPIGVRATLAGEALVIEEPAVRARQTGERGGAGA